MDQWAEKVAVAEIDAAAVASVVDIPAYRRIDGIAALRQHVAALQGEGQLHRYAVVDPEVRIHGDVAVLSFRYEPHSSEGKPLVPLTRWKAASVYRRSAGEWRSVHTHWSVVKEP